MKFWQVDAFTNRPFGGNPAAVMIFESYPDDALMLNIAAEMNLSETAFVVMQPEPHIRWFTPGGEVDLCGHATLAAAHILWQEGILKDDEVIFRSRSGPLTVTQTATGYTLDFPAQPALGQASAFADHFGESVVFAGSNGHDYMVVLDNDAAVRSYVPDLAAISALEDRGFVLTAQDSTGQYDYIYRAFFPKYNIAEDPVTGSANTGLGPYWTKVLNKSHVKAHQASARGGDLDISVQDDRVLISGQAVTVAEGSLLI